MWFGKNYDKAKYYFKESQKSKEELQQIFDSVEATIWSIDLRTQTALVSAGIEKLYGYGRQEFFNNPNLWKEVVYSDDQSIANEMEEELLSEKISEREYRIIRPNGEIRWVQRQATPIFDSCGNTIKINGVTIDITERKKAEEKIYHMAYHDDLTGLPNRNNLDNYIKQSLIRSNRNKQTMAVMNIDLDRFKVINDTLGHNYGDLLLQQVSERLKKSVRHNDFVSRHSGDEFIIIFEDINKNEVSKIAQQIINEFSYPFLLNGQDAFTSPSIGLCFYPTNGEDKETIIKKAGIALYHAKKQGKNNYQFYTSNLNNMFPRKLMNLENDLRKALHRNELRLYYQPQVELNTGKIVGVEALLRWQHPDLGLVPPSDFIPLAEETGLIVPIGKWVLETACKQNKAWQEVGFPSMSVAINISVRQFKDKNFIETVTQVLKETKLEPQYLDIEITESIMQNIKESSLILNQLKTLGVQISIDDFGTGYSSLSLLNKLPFDNLKIDQSFVNDLVYNSNTKSIVKTIIDMGQNLNFNVIAEGIENEQQLSLLKQEKCNFGQGYFFNRPLPVEDIEKVLERSFVFSI